MNENNACHVAGNEQQHHQRHKIHKQKTKEEKEDGSNDKIENWSLAAVVMRRPIVRGRHGMTWRYSMKQQKCVASCMCANGAVDVLIYGLPNNIVKRFGIYASGYVSVRFLCFFTSFVRIQWMCAVVRAVLPNVIVCRSGSPCRVTFKPMFFIKTLIVLISPSPFYSIHPVAFVVASSVRTHIFISFRLEPRQFLAACHSLFFFWSSSRTTCSMCECVCVCERDKMVQFASMRCRTMGIVIHTFNVRARCP